jgi:hypothetical protein
VTVVLGVAHGDVTALRLARARCQAAVDQDPTDAAAAQAARLLDVALDRE